MALVGLQSRNSWEPRLPVVNSVGAFTPLALGASLYDMWDAEAASTITLSGSNVTEWRSVKNGYAAAQAVAESQPAYSDTSFNNRPGLTFDGTDDELTYAGVGNFPVAATYGEIWMLFSYDGLGTDAAAKHLFGYGSATAYSGVRSTRRASVGNINRMTGLMGDGSANQIAFAPGDCSGLNVVRVQVGAQGITASRNGEAGTPTAGVAATVSNQTTIGAGPVTLQRLNAPCKISMIAITSPLTADQAAQMTTYLKSRGGIA